MVNILLCLSRYLFDVLLIFILDVIKYCDHPRWYEKIPPGGGISDWRWHLQLEVGPLIGGEISNWRWHLQWRWDLWLEAPMLHVGISYSFEKKKRLFIVDYIKPSPVYQVKCKLVWKSSTPFVTTTYFSSKITACIKFTVLLYWTSMLSLEVSTLPNKYIMKTIWTI